MILLYCKSLNLLRMYTKGIYTTLCNKDLMKVFVNNKENRREECYSECMTPERALQWWANPQCLLFQNSETLAMRQSAMGLLLKNGNQSGVERTFSRYKRYASSSRNRSDPQTTFNEVLIAAMKKNNSLLQTLKTEKPKTKPTDETQDQRTSRHGYKFIKK